MKRTALFLLIFCTLASAQAQTYFGIGGARLISSFGSVPLVSVQVGGRTTPEFDHLEVRAAFDSLLLFSDLSLDVFASVGFPDASLRVYFGGGPDVFIFAPLNSIPGQERLPVSVGLHGILGSSSLGELSGPLPNCN